MTRPASPNAGTLEMARLDTIAEGVRASQQVGPANVSGRLRSERLRATLLAE